MFVEDKIPYFRTRFLDLSHTLLRENKKPSNFEKNKLLMLHCTPNLFSCQLYLYITDLFSQVSGLNPDSHLWSLQDQNCSFP